MEKKSQILKNALITVFFSFYALFCVRVSNVSIKTIGITAAFWMIAVLIIFLIKNKEECLLGIEIVFIVLFLKWVFLCGILQPILSKIVSETVMLSNTPVAEHLVINLCLCAICVSGIQIWEKHINKRKAKGE